MKERLKNKPYKSRDRKPKIAWKIDKEYRSVSLFQLFCK